MAPLSEPAAILNIARNVLTIEAAAVSALAARLDASFNAAHELLLNCRARVVVEEHLYPDLLCTCLQKLLAKLR